MFLLMYGIVVITSYFIAFRIYEPEDKKEVQMFENSLCGEYSLLISFLLFEHRRYTG